MGHAVTPSLSKKEGGFGLCIIFTRTTWPSSLSDLGLS